MGIDFLRASRIKTGLQHTLLSRRSTKEHIYRSENCYMACRTRTILDRCGCVPFYAHDYTTAVQQRQQPQLCNLTHGACLGSVISEIYSLKLRDPQCDCLPDCEGTRYTVSITGEPLDAARFRPGRFL